MSDILIRSLTGEAVRHFELYVGGLTIRTASGVIFNVFNQFRIAGFDGDKPCGMIGAKIERVDVRDELITFQIGSTSLLIGMSERDWLGPEAWSLKCSDGTLIVENGN